MGFGVRNVEELLDCLGASKKEWAHPELANNFSAWSVFDGADWAHLLSRRPALDPYCDANDGWKKFLPDDWIWLLRYRPYFKEKRTYNRVFQ